MAGKPLSDKVAIVTGSSQNIGKFIALKLSKMGAAVVVNYPESKDRDNAEGIVSEITSEGGRAISVQADLRKLDDIPLLFDRAIETFFEQIEHDALFSVTSVKTRFYWKDGTGINHDPKHLIRTQDLEPIYEENSCFYIFSKATNKRTKNRLGSNPMMFPLNRLEAVDIDDIEDFYWAEFLLHRKIENEKK